MGIACGLLFLSCPLIICACSSVQISCNFLDDHAPVVFIGTVLPQTDAETIRILNGTAPVIFKVTAHVRGDVGEKVEVYGSGNSCDFSFKPGQSYLVFAYFASGHLVTSEASSTRLMLEAGGLLRQLQALKESRQSASLFGFLGRRNGANPGQPMPGVTIKAISGRRVATTTTAPDGSFEFIHLPPAEYRVKALLPKTFVPPPERLEIVKPGESCDVGSMWTAPNGRIQGRVVDSGMKPERGVLSIIPANAARTAILNIYAVGKRGTFEFTGIPPGRYQLVFHPQGHPELVSYYPPDEAAVIELGLGQRIEHITVVAH